MHRVFIQDSEPPRTISKLLLLILVVFICLIGIDRIFGRIIPRLTIEPPFILRFQNVQGVERLWTFSEAGIKPIVFVGSSQLHMGISPHVFNDRIKLVSGKDVNSLDISLWGGLISSEHELITNLIIPHHPQVMIYGIEMQALMPRLQNGLGVQDFRNKPLGYAVSASSPLERNILLWLLQHSNLMRYRDNVREWLTGIREIDHLGYVPTMVDDLGHFIDPTISDRDPVTITAGFTPFSVTDYTRGLIVDIGSSCKQNNVQCILLNMPLHPSAYQYITPADETIYHEVLREAGLPIWDFNTKECREMLEDSSFYNLNHLNASGAERLSPMVADVYAHVFFNLPIDGNAKCATLQ